MKNIFFAKVCQNIFFAKVCQNIFVANVCQAKKHYKNRKKIAQAKNNIKHSKTREMIAATEADWRIPSPPIVGKNMWVPYVVASREV